ncbi:hypothetical protein chiPu_0026789, partial [Chiloscyllium punctatum]|nr:hypothetical protein [Chiloscyllium punctatum]
MRNAPGPFMASGLDASALIPIGWCVVGVLPSLSGTSVLSPPPPCTRCE